MPLELRIMTPEGLCYQGAVDSVVAPGPRGSFGVLMRHAPMVAAIAPGMLRGAAGPSLLWFVVSGGAAEIQNDRVTVLVGSACQAANADDAEIRLAEMRGVRLPKG